MAFNFTLPLRIAQGVFTIIVLGLTAYGKFSKNLHDPRLSHPSLPSICTTPEPGPQPIVWNSSPLPSPTTPPLTQRKIVCDWWTTHWYANSPEEINYLIFVVVWTLLALAYLVVAPARFPAAAHKFAMLAVEALTMLFWFAGFIALAVWLNGRVCFGSVCASAKAATVFAAFEW